MLPFEESIPSSNQCRLFTAALDQIALRGHGVQGFAWYCAMDSTGNVLPERVTAVKQLSTNVLSHACLAKAVIAVVNLHEVETNQVLQAYLAQGCLLHCLRSLDIA